MSPALSETILLCVLQADPAQRRFAAAQAHFEPALASAESAESRDGLACVRRWQGDRDGPNAATSSPSSANGSEGGNEQRSGRHRASSGHLPVRDEQVKDALVELSDVR